MATAAHAESPRETVAHAVVLTDNADEQRRLVAGLAGNSDPDIPRLLNLWKESGFFIATAPAGGWQGLAEGAKVAVTLGDDKDADDKQAASVLATGAPLRDPAGQPVRLVATDLDNADTDFDLRLAMKTVLDLAAVTAADPVQRRQVVEQIGLAQDPAKLPVLRERVKVETDAHVQQALRVAIALLELRSEDAATQIAATNTLGAVRALSARDALTTLARETETTRPQVARAAQAAGKAIETHLQLVNFFGTLFRGLSLASVLLVVAIGLAITFGLMGIINMAHGELIAIGAYTTYLVQNIFGNGMALSPFGWSFRLPGLNAGGWFYESYFLFALPLSFLSAALAGVLLERCVIRFLYRRPLESLLATWGVSLVLQQLLRSVFGANNVQVYSPSWLSGHWTVFDVLLGWNRVFVIAFAVAIIAGTWALLTKTPFGLLIRAVTQNRAMAACMGVRTERVNVLTFAFGSGLAGLAGAFLAQIGNVGPSLGQNYIVDS
ncbi:MAG: urea ABC transporter permease subunit UrtB, partial [Verrucomicrobia bacterium]|nr:urea ABC transporter permease subunit UrtB [Verrucomicrobiota bacterium]